MVLSLTWHRSSIFYMFFGNSHPKHIQSLSIWPCYEYNLDEIFCQRNYLTCFYVNYGNNKSSPGVGNVKDPGIGGELGLYLFRGVGHVLKAGAGELDVDR